MIKRLICIRIQLRPTVRLLRRRLRIKHKTGLSAVALTDHDTINGLAEFKRACGEYGIEGISGVEISAKYEKEMHIVGLFI